MPTCFQVVTGIHPNNYHLFITYVYMSGGQILAILIQCQILLRKFFLFPTHFIFSGPSLRMILNYSPLYSRNTWGFTVEYHLTSSLVLVLWVPNVPSYFYKILCLLPHVSKRLWMFMQELLVFCKILCQYFPLFNCRTFSLHMRFFWKFNILK